MNDMNDKMLRFEKFDNFGDFDDDVDVNEAAFCKLVPVYFMACDRRWKVQSDNYYSDCAHPHPLHISTNNKWL